MKLLSIEAKSTFNGGLERRLVNPASIATVDFPGFFDAGQPNVQWVKFTTGSGAEYIVTDTIWTHMVNRAGITIEVIK